MPRGQLRGAEVGAAGRAAVLVTASVVLGRVRAAALALLGLVRAASLEIGSGQSKHLRVWESGRVDGRVGCGGSRRGVRPHPP